MEHHQPISLRAVSKGLAACALAFALAGSNGCGGKSNTIIIQEPKFFVEPDQKLAAWPHRFDVYRADPADKAVVFLHGGGGTKYYFAYQLGIKRDPGNGNYIVADSKVLIDHKAIAVFPQGQNLPTAPLSFTWNNYVMDSGQDDMQFLRDLVAYISTTYKVNKFYVVGHSNGGMMVNRIWCEAPEMFDAYVAISGPPSVHFADNQTPCSPAQVKPILSIVGSDDNVLQDWNWEAQTWTINPVLASNPGFVDPDLIGDRYFLPTRVTDRCGGTVSAGDADATTSGTLTTWSYCNDAIRLIRVESAGHAVDSLETAAGTSLLGIIFSFIDSNG